ncbi:MAG TPA: hypothetical protein V6C81_20625 [Planktothrix sp.]|jgi:hypothetical protein
MRTEQAGITKVGLCSMALCATVGIMYGLLSELRASIDPLAAALALLLLSILGTVIVCHTRKKGSRAMVISVISALCVASFIYDSAAHYPGTGVNGLWAK